MVGPRRWNWAETVPTDILWCPGVSSFDRTINWDSKFRGFRDTRSPDPLFFPTDSFRSGETKEQTFYSRHYGETVLP